MVCYWSQHTCMFLVVSQSQSECVCTVQKRDTGEGLHGAARHSTRMRSIIHGPWQCHGVYTEFRRGFCTLVLSFETVSLNSITYDKSLHTKGKYV